MSVNKLLVPGFGIGAAFGVPTTVGLAPTSTLSITSSIVGQYHVTGLVTGTSMIQFSTTNGVTATYTVLNAAPGRVLLDGVSASLVNTTTSVSVVFIQS